MIHKQHQLSVSSQIQEGMDWITAALHEGAKNWHLAFLNSHWETSESPNTEKLYSLIVEGRNKKKSIKLFTGWELENCSSDKELQGEMEMRLLKILTFVSPTPSKAKSKNRNPQQEQIS